VLIPWGRSLLETGDANQLILQGCGSFWRTLLASKHGVHCPDVSFGHVLVFFPLTAEGRETMPVRTLDSIGQNGDSIRLLQAVRRVPVEWVTPKARATASVARLCGIDTGPALMLRGDEPRIGKRPSRLLPKYPRGLPYHQAAALYRTISDWRPCRLTVDVGYRPIPHECRLTRDPDVQRVPLLVSDYARW